MIESPDPCHAPIVDAIYMEQFHAMSNSFIIFGLWAPYYDVRKEELANYINVKSTCTSIITVIDNKEMTNASVVLKNIKAGMVTDKHYKKLLVLMNKKKPMDPTQKNYNVLFNRFEILSSNEGISEMLGRLNLPIDLIDFNLSRQKTCSMFHSFSTCAWKYSLSFWMDKHESRVPGPPLALVSTNQRH
jgi:hypothetical protein